MVLNNVAKFYKILIKIFELESRCRPAMIMAGALSVTPVCPSVLYVRNYIRTDRGNT